MANQLAAANSSTASTNGPRSVPDEEIGRYATTPAPLETAVLSNPNSNVLPVHNGGSPTASTSSKDSSTVNIQPQSSYLLPPPATSSSHVVPANPASLATALRAINEGGTSGLPFRDRPPPHDSPYSKSISSTAPGSPRIPPVRQNSGTQTPRVRPHATTLSIPGMTRSNISPDGKIADRDVAAKLVIIMVGLPARGKSYITKKIKRYLSWQQHDTRIFNVGNRRRVAVGMNSPMIARAESNPMDAPKQVAKILFNGTQAAPPLEPLNGTQVVSSLESPRRNEPAEWDLNDPNATPMDQSANFFDPKNASAFRIREQCAIDTLDELLDYLISGGGSVGILDATNSTINRRQMLFDHIKRREPKLGILFIESVCKNPDLLEANMRLKLSGPDYKDKDPMKSLADFKERVRQYESAYVPLGDYEEEHAMQYIKMTDVGKKLTHFGLEGFLSGGIAHYLSSFNLAPRQIWITRHGQSYDNQLGKIGGNSELTERGHFYALTLYKFITQKRKEWLVEQKNKIAQASFPPQPGDRSPPYPELNRELEEKNTCVWTSMLKRSIQTAEYFEADEDYDVKAWEMLNELNAGRFEGMTYGEISRNHTGEYTKRQLDKLHYVYPGVGGEGYLQIISRVRDLVREIERIKDHLLIIGHRSVCRVLMAYFMDLTRDDIADLDVPLGMVYAIEPKPYGIEFHAYKYDEDKGWFDELPNYVPQRASDQNA
ncbi:6-phosphofructo-2-kinase [Pseudomassariella vexata]|uniref:6-phosphofructo-2-kinase n=1 Tax=Pseudomassariella vexata TaxID=1141098 RepID=A0A1Y2DXS8_9PEZI|nr:6-phosphofructo-2-kinase [Pseudomassariella vexata]ORY64108.1 6-phosphofructo-2-kinase [Pseudomassariella vexata]